jgi:linoleoyl-CoA desaturase
MQKVRFIEKDTNKAVFFTTLRSRVESYFSEKKISKHYNTTMVIKTIVLLLAYIGPFILILTVPLSLPLFFSLWVVMGFAKAGVGMSVMHDANHGAYASNRKVNYWLGHTLNLLGGSVFNWKMQHNVLHHTYTNITNMDDDIEDKLFFRFSPHTELKWYHRFQFIYAFLFYGILTLYWALLKDFVQFKKFKAAGVNHQSESKNRVTLLKIVASKLFYVFVFFALPIFILNMTAWSYISGFLIMHFVAGIILTVIFQLAHTVENTSHPLPNEEGTIENNWAIHQLNTTVNFSRKNRFLTWYLGGLNYQVEHHLFPNICHVHYPAISTIVKSTSEEFGIPYLENKTFLNAVNSHIKTMKALGRPAH